MSKPIHNRVMCPECFKQKMLFESQKKADNFIKWNGENIDTHGGELRSYYCPACGGWHISSKPYKESYAHNTENLIKRYENIVNTKAIDTIEMPATIKVNNPMEVYNDIPEDIIKSGKAAIKKFLNEYIAEHSIDDKSGLLRNKIYTIYREKRWSDNFFKKKKNI